MTLFWALNSLYKHGRRQVLFDVDTVLEMFCSEPNLLAMFVFSRFSDIQASSCWVVRKWRWDGMILFWCVTQRDVPPGCFCGNFYFSQIVKRTRRMGNPSSRVDVLFAYPEQWCSTAVFTNYFFASCTKMGNRWSRLVDSVQFNLHRAFQVQTTNLSKKRLFHGKKIKCKYSMLYLGLVWKMQSNEYKQA